VLIPLHAGRLEFRFWRKFCWFRLPPPSQSGDHRSMAYFFDDKQFGQLVRIMM